MLQINRNFLTIPTNDIYFESKKGKRRYKAKLSWYTHRLKPSRRLRSKQTIHINLQQDELTLINNLPSQTNYILFEYSKDKFKINSIPNPSNEQLRDFQRLFNEQTNEGKVNRSKFQSLVSLRDQKALRLTKIENEDNETLCYRIYVVDGQNALLLYASNTNIEESNKSNLILCWENINMFKKLGYLVYDFGGLDHEQAERLSAYFGGQEVTVFSGYIAKSPFLKLIAKLSQWREKKI